jgi:F-type H+-transporting ATPase subunit b
MQAPPLGWFLVDFVVFVALLVHFTRRPLKDAFLHRHLAIKKAVADNEAAFAQAKRQFDESRDKLAAIEHDVAGLITRVKEDGQAERERIVHGGRAYAERLKKDSGAIIAQEATSARERLRNYVAERALAQAEAMLVAELNDADRERMLEAAIAEIEKVEALAAAHRRRAASGATAAGGDAAGGAS